jgi:hypothetical protein
MAAVTVPTLGVVGSDDPYLTQFRALAALMPALSVIVIAGATHGSAVARPEFASAVRAFIAAHPRGTRKRAPATRLVKPPASRSRSRTRC